MGIEEPVGLVALAAAAVPLLLHLRARSPVRSVPFPNVELLREVARGLRRSSLVADAGLLAARVSVVAFAALAISRPYVGARPRALGTLAEGDVVVMLDRSSAWGDGAAFEDARAAAGEVIDLVEQHGRATLLAFDDLPAPALEGDRARAALGRVRPTGRARSIGAALSAAERILRPADPDGGRSRPRGPRARTVVLLTTPDGAAEALATGRPAGERLIAYAPGGGGAAKADLAVVGASLEGPAARVGGRIRVRARIRRTGNAGAFPEGGRELRLFLDEDARPAAGVELPAFARDPAGRLGVREPNKDLNKDLNREPNNEFSILIETPRRRPGSSLLRVEIHPPDARPADDRRFLVLPPVERIRVLALASEGRGSARDLRALARAVEALARAGASRAVLPIEAETLPASGLTPEALEAFDAVALGDVEAIPPALWETLAAFVREGGAVLGLAPGRVPPEAKGLFGLDRAEGDARSFPAGGTAVARGGSRDDPVGEQSLRLVGRALFPSCLRLNARAAARLRFETGDPALVEARLGRGRASLFAAGAGHLAGRPSVLVPLVDALLRLAAARPPAPLAVDAGLTPVTVGFAPGARPAGLRLLSPEGRRTGVEISEAPAAPRGHASAILPCEGPGLWKLLARPAAGAPSGVAGGVASGTIGREYVERIIGVNVEPPPGVRAGRRSPAGGRRLVHSGSELVEALRGRGSVGLAPLLAGLALAALALELVLAGRRARASAPGIPLGNTP